jgi:hypothetical protein
VTKSYGGTLEVEGMGTEGKYLYREIYGAIIHF